MLGLGYSKVRLNQSVATSIPVKRTGALAWRIQQGELFLLLVHKMLTMEQRTPSGRDPTGL